MGRVVHPHIITPDSALGGMDIRRSVRCGNGGAFTRTQTATGNQKVWTWSAWVKKWADGGTSHLFSSEGNNDGISAIYFNGNRIHTYFDTSGSNPYGAINDRYHRDPNSWMHIVWQVDALNTDQRIWINGQEESVTGSNDPPNYAYSMNQSGKSLGLGISGYGGSHTNGTYLAEVHHSDGYKYDPSYYGYTDPQTGIWRPKKVTGISYGTNGFYLDFSDNSTATALGKDRSGNGNDWTPNGSISVANDKTNDSLLDTPTNNFITLNSIHRFNHDCIFDQGNLQATGSSSSYPGAAASIALSSGKWYYEFQIDTKVSTPMCGVIKNDYSSGGAGRILYRSGGHYVMHDGAEPTDPDSYGVGDIIGVAIDLDDAAGKIRFYKNGTLQTVNAALNNVKAHLSISTLGGLFPYVQMYTNDVCTVNFGQRPFSYTPPTGFRALNYKNLTTPRGDSIVDPRDHFDTLLYTGNGGNKTVTGLQFKPDFAWIKSLSDGHHPSWTDSVRGMLKTLSSTRNDVAEYNESAGLNEFLHNGLGFNGNNYYSVNVNGANFVAWCWKGGGSSDTYNIDGVGYATAAAAGLNGGTITPTGTSINTISGLSIIAYTGNGTNGASMSHGLPSAPKLMIHRSRGQSRNWYTITTALDGSADYWYLNNTNAPGNSAVTAPTSDLMYFTSSQESNNNGENYIVYAFCDIPGFLKMGVYTGNGQSDGTYIHLGFRPAWIMIRKSGGTEDWVIYDNKRDVDNIVGFRIYADIANAAASNASDLDFLSDGFKHRKTSGLTNASTTYFYMAFAEQSGRTPYMSPSNAR